MHRMVKIHNIFFKTHFWDCIANIIFNYYIGPSRTYLHHLMQFIWSSRFILNDDNCIFIDNNVILKFFWCTEQWEDTQYIFLNTFKILNI